jgi:hypothetical protein
VGAYIRAIRTKLKLRDYCGCDKRGELKICVARRNARNVDPIGYSFECKSTADHKPTEARRKYENMVGRNTALAVRLRKEFRSGLTTYSKLYSSDSDK